MITQPLNRHAEFYPGARASGEHFIKTFGLPKSHLSNRVIVNTGPIFV